MHFFLIALIFRVSEENKGPALYIALIKILPDYW